MGRTSLARERHEGATMSDATMSGCCKLPEVEPSTAFVVRVDNANGVVGKFEAPDDMELEFALVEVDDEAGLEAAGLGLKPGAGLGEMYWSPDEDRSTTYPPLSHLMPPSLKDAHTTLCVFRGLKLRKGQKVDFCLQNREGVMPYDVTFTFYRRRTGC